jgi:predicted DNA-binding protein (UPF0251 family)|tara:strand:+ start:589 stop:891 length:303 start_codon:yes stop_codon:yes gene_type:complete
MKVRQRSIPSLSTPPPGGGKLKLRSDCAEMTPIQREAIGLAALGHTTKSAAAHIGIAQTTMVERLRLARKRLHAETTVQAVALYYAQQTGAHIDEKGDFR